MGNEQSSVQNAFMGLSREQVAKIIYEELSKSDFQFNNFNAMVPPIINRLIMENSVVVGNYLTQMIVRGVMGNFFRR